MKRSYTDLDQQALQIHFLFGGSIVGWLRNPNCLLASSLATRPMTLTGANYVIFYVSIE